MKYVYEVIYFDGVREKPLARNETANLSDLKQAFIAENNKENIGVGKRPTLLRVALIDGDKVIARVKLSLDENETYSLMQAQPKDPKTGRPPIAAIVKSEYKRLTESNKHIAQERALKSMFNAAIKETAHPDMIHHENTIGSHRRK